MSDTPALIVWIVLLSVVALGLGAWLIRQLGLADRIDDAETIEDRERMLDEIERRFWEREQKRLRKDRNA